MIRVLVQPPTKRGRLYPRYDEDAGILVLESREPRAWPYGLDIDGMIVLDIDESRVLANLDLHIRADLWERASTAFWPNEVNSGDLAFPDETLKTKSFHLPLRVRTNPNVHYIRVDIGEREPQQYVALSNECLALVTEDQLVGFMIRGVHI